MPRATIFTYLRLCLLTLSEYWALNIGSGSKISAKFIIELDQSSQIHY